MTFPPFRFAVTCLALAGSAFSAAAAEDPARAGVDFLENKIRPVLVERCFKCHGGEKPQGKLRLDQRHFVLQGGKSGRVVLPIDPSGSLLIWAIRGVDQELSMPPDEKDQLTSEEVQNFVMWIQLGAPFPGAGWGSVLTSATPQPFTPGRDG